MMPAFDTQQGISLRELLDGRVDAAALGAVADVTVDGLTLDSRQARASTLFIALQGESAHGLAYAAQAVDNGASVVLWDRNSGDDLTLRAMLNGIRDRAVVLHCDELRMKTGEIAARFYDFPSRNLNLIGVTGTDGKTSVSHFLAHCLNSETSPCGILGTLGNGLIHALRPTGLTTADAVRVQQGLAALVDAGAGSAVMEVSSHGLAQGRVNAVGFDTAVFTNLAQDHLDYHVTMEAYADAKRRLFDAPGLKSAVINLDDSYGRELAKQVRHKLVVWGYSVDGDEATLREYADFIVCADGIEITPTGYEFTVITPEGCARATIRLLGRFNVSNVLAVIAALLLNHRSLEEVLQHVSALAPVSGRMEQISVERKPAVIVDYAHTPQGLRAACLAAREHCSGELWCVFGCGGDRDRSKRPLMAAVTEQLADHVIVTSDNPRHEPPERIFDDIMAGFELPSRVTRIVDRREAIAYAINTAKAGDVILLAGKGHEAVQIVADSCIEFDDRSVARELLGVRS
jgi:UDP-N-acetylmuramoyl-L-alanyl-D-glutamate--2,6-diaminopimelate ligase